MVAVRRSTEVTLVDVLVTERTEPLPIARYAPTHAIGRGGMGEVTAAHDRQVGREVAIKRMAVADPTPVHYARFLREARIQGQLEHPAIVPVHEVGLESDGTPYFVMKKVTGTTFAEVLRFRPDYTRPRVLRAFIDVCSAVDFAHRKNIVHRDLKPANVLVGELGEVYVLDWGIARVLGEPDDDPPGHVLGTAGYMAPEQLRGERDLDRRVDVYALGCILFEILTRKRFHAVTGNLRASSHAPDVPPELDELCLRAVASDRHARIGTARELGDAVQRYLDGDRDLARRTYLALVHLDAARDAMSRVDSEDNRRIAMREAGHALALDPTLVPAAEIVGSLVLAPPAVTPSGVVSELRELDRTAARRYARLGFAAHAGYAALAIVLLVLGLRDAVYVGGLFAAGTAGAALAVRQMRRASGWHIYAIIGVDLAIIELFARMFTPFLIAPGVAAVTLMVLAFHPLMARRWLLPATCAAALAMIAGAWVLEAVGALKATMTMQNGALVLDSTAIGIHDVPAGPGLCAFAAVLLVGATLLGVAQARAIRKARHDLHVQAWHLRQLLSPR